MRRRRRFNRLPSVRLSVLLVAAALSAAIVALAETGAARTVGSKLNSGLFSPLRSGIDDITGPIGSFFANGANYSSLERQNQWLQFELGQLRMEGLVGQAERKQNNQLKGLLTIKQRFLGPIPFVIAYVTAASQDGLQSDVTISRGTADGISTGMAVVEEQGFLGQIISASAHHATVELLTDGRSSLGVSYGTLTGPVSAQISGRGTSGALDVSGIQSQGSPAPAKGTTLKTSCFPGMAFPSGIPVAKVTSAHDDEATNSVVVTAAPLAERHPVGYVAVVIWTPSPTGTATC